jgi:hypothetical protein
MRVGSAVGRKQKKALADLAPVLESTLGPGRAELETIVASLVRAEMRAAFLVTGDLTACFEELRSVDPRVAVDLRGVLEHQAMGDLTRFALSPESTRLRWRTGAVWGGA